MLTEIELTDVGDFKIGNAQDVEAGTGCTVLVFEEGAAAGLDVSGGGPASRESELLKPLATADAVHAIMLAGGSAFGLDAAGGAMQYLEERGIGLDMGVTKVPLVCESCLFDLAVADPSVRPDKAMGYAACEAAYRGDYEDGNVGAGTGATVGKVRGMGCCTKSGIGSYAVQVGDLKVGAVVAVNAMGDVFDYKTGAKVAGVRSVGSCPSIASSEMDSATADAADGAGDADAATDMNAAKAMAAAAAAAGIDPAAIAAIAGTANAAETPLAEDDILSLYAVAPAFSAEAGSVDPADVAAAAVAGIDADAAAGADAADIDAAAGSADSAAADPASGAGAFPANTTIGVVLTNAGFAKPQLCKIAAVAQDGIARSIRPVHTSMDGDSVYAVSLGDVPVEMDVVSTLAVRVMSEAILRAVRSAHTAYGIPGAADAETM